MQAKDAEFKQQLEAAGALETDLRAQLNVSLLLFWLRQNGQWLSTTSVCNTTLLTTQPKSRWFPLLCCDNQWCLLRMRAHMQGKASLAG